MVIKTRPLFDGNKIPVLGLGTWAIGGKWEPDYSKDNQELEAIENALNLGYRHIDTAEAYGIGHTEELVGKAIKNFPRKSLFITTKVVGENLRYQNVRKACEGSLKRLGINYIDLYLIHWPNFSIPLEETFKALNELVYEGKVRYLGVSNFGLDDLRKAMELSETPIITNQVHYNLLVKDVEENGVLSFCEKNKILITAYQPIERGEVADIKLVQELAKKYNKTPAQIALNYLISDPNVIAIPKAVRIEHQKENLGALDFELEDEDLKMLKNL
jgi:diketogulonate reductase-like aldo/keto reductase